MKRENGYNLTHHFPFGERFDETLMKETAAPSLPVCPCADRQLCRHNGTEYHARLAKRKRRPMSTDITADTIAGFWGNKKP